MTATCIPHATCRLVADVAVQPPPHSHLRPVGLHVCKWPTRNQTSGVRKSLFWSKGNIQELALADVASKSVPSPWTFFV
eukprot:3823620-Pyramimonas_sp.AAC.2